VIWVRNGEVILQETNTHIQLRFDKKRQSLYNRIVPGDRNFRGQQLISAGGEDFYIAKYGYSRDIVNLKGAGGVNIDRVCWLFDVE